MRGGGHKRLISHIAQPQNETKDGATSNLYFVTCIFFILERGMKECGIRLGSDGRERRL